MGAVFLRVIQAHHLLQVSQGRGKLPEKKRSHPLRKVRLRQESGIVHTLGQAQEIFAELVCLLELCPVIINRPQSQQRPEELLAISHLLAELSRPGVKTFEFWGRMPLEDQECRAQGKLQREFLLKTFEGVWQGAEQFQPFCQVHERFHIGRALNSALTGLLPVRNGLCSATCLGVVMRQQFRLLLTHLGKPFLQHLRNPLVVLSLGAPEQRRIGRLLD
jgi:hypothetical protein